MNFAEFINEEIIRDKILKNPTKDELSGMSDYLKGKNLKGKYEIRFVIDVKNDDIYIADSSKYTHVSLINKLRIPDAYDKYMKYFKGNMPDVETPDYYYGAGIINANIGKIVSQGWVLKAGNEFNKKISKKLLSTFTNYKELDKQ